MNLVEDVQGAEMRGRHDELDVLLGERIRHRRRSRNMTLQDLADASRISIGQLSQIERGRSSPSLRVIASIANALDVGIGNLFEESLSAPREPDNKVVVRSTERKMLGFWRTGISKELLTPTIGQSGLEIFMIVLEPDGTTGAQLYTHQGEEGGLVLEGSIAIAIDGQEYRLEAGDSFRFESTRPHSFRNLGRAQARVVWVNAHQLKAD